MSEVLAQRPSPKPDPKWIDRNDCKCNSCEGKFYTFSGYPKCPHCGSEDYKLKYGEVAVYVNQLTGEVCAEVIPG